MSPAARSPFMQRDSWEGRTDSSHEGGKPALSFETTTSALSVLAQTRQAVDFAEIILINTQICKLWPDMCSSTLVEMPIPSHCYVKVL